MKWVDYKSGDVRPNADQLIEWVNSVGATDKAPAHALNWDEPNHPIVRYRVVSDKPATDVDTVLNERGSRYGVFTGHAQITVELKRTIRLHLNARGKKLADDQQEALDMICHKIGRIINGDPDYADSWVDIAGYAKLVSDRLETGIGR